MSAGVAGIDVGDAVMNFLANTTELDEAFAKVESTPARMAPANDAILSLNATIEELIVVLKESGNAGLNAGNNIGEGMQRAKLATREAVGEIALLGEATGVTLPRHVRSFVANLPGVGTALEAAFSATAVLFLIQALVEGTHKLVDWIDTTFIYTAAMKAVEASVAQTNKIILEQNAIYDKAAEAMKLFGLQGSQLSEVQMQELTDSLNKNKFALNEATVAVDGYTKGWEKGTQEQVNNAIAKQQTLTATVRAQEEQLRQIDQTFRKQQQDDSNRAAELNIAIQKAGLEAGVKLHQTFATLELDGAKTDYLKLSQIRSDAEEKLYQIDINAMKLRLTLLTDESTETRAKRAQLNSQIEIAETQHQNTLVSRYQDFKRRLYDASHNLPIPLIDVPVPDSVVNDSDIAFQKMEEAAHAVGIVLSTDLGKAAQDAGFAYIQLKNSGVASIGDLLQAQIKLIQATIAYKNSIGEAHAADSKELINLQSQYDALGGKIDKTHKQTHDFFQQFQLDMKHGVSGMEEVKETGKQAFNALASGIASAVASAILSQQSLGVALEQATAQALASIAGQAIVKALFYTAEGFAALANPVGGISASEYFAAAAEMALVGGAAAVAARGLNAASGSSQTAAGASAAVGNTPTVSAPAQPVATTNVQHLASGGLVTRSTLVRIGDSTKDNGNQEEAAIPLNDPTAVKKIVDALGGGGGPQIHVHVRGMVSPDNLKKVVKDINRKVGKGQVNLVASNSLRLTRRSN